jgi:hypothetical protein
MRGYSSSRQRRHADQWLALGSALALRGLDGSPAGQRGFIGHARRIAGQHVSDALLLSIALTIAEIGRALEPETIGELGKRLARSADGMAPDEIAALPAPNCAISARAPPPAARNRAQQREAPRRPGPILTRRAPAAVAAVVWFPQPDQRSSPARPIRRVAVFHTPRPFVV